MGMRDTTRGLLPAAPQMWDLLKWEGKHPQVCTVPT